MDVALRFTKNENQDGSRSVALLTVQQLHAAEVCHENEARDVSFHLLAIFRLQSFCIKEAVEKRRSTAIQMTCLPSLFRLLPCTC
jgi:hypothetical protein